MNVFIAEVLLQCVAACLWKLPCAINLYTPIPADSFQLVLVEGGRGYQEYVCKRTAQIAEKVFYLPSQVSSQHQSIDKTFLYSFFAAG